MFYFDNFFVRDSFVEVLLCVFFMNKLNNSNNFLSKNEEKSGLFRCIKCTKLLAKEIKLGELEIKCVRCGALNKKLENMIEQIVVMGLDGKILYINKVMERVTGYTLQESFGKKPAELWGGQMSQEFYKDIWQKIINTKDSFVVILRNKKKNGELYDLTLQVSPVLNEKGEILFLVGIETVL